VPARPVVLLPVRAACDQVSGALRSKSAKIVRGYTNMEVVRIGFIGCGGNGTGHLRRLKTMDDVEIVGVCDIVEERADKAAAGFQGRAYYDHRDMLASEELDAVYISIPVDAHGEVEKNVIAAGLPFFVEKPVARQMETAREVAAAVEEGNILTCVGYQLRYYNSVAAVKRYLHNKDVAFVDGHYWCGTGRSTTWHVQFQRSGGQLVEQATHTIDLMRYLVGDIVEVSCYQANRVLKQITSPDVYAVNLRFDQGAQGSLTTVWTLDPGDWSNANIIQLFFDDKRLRISGEQLEVSPADPDLVVDEKPTPVIDRVFVNAVRNNDQAAVLSPYADAVKSLAISLAANESARLGGKPVQVASG